MSTPWDDTQNGGSPKNGSNGEEDDDNGEDLGSPILKYQRVDDRAPAAGAEVSLEEAEDEAEGEDE